MGHTFQWIMDYLYVSKRNQELNIHEFKFQILFVMVHNKLYLFVNENVMKVYAPKFDA